MKADNGTTAFEPATGNRFILLLAAMSVQLLVFPVLRICFPEAMDGVFVVVFRVFVYVVLFAALFAVSRYRIVVISLLVILCAAAATEAMWEVRGTNALANLNDLLSAVFLFACGFLIVVRIFSLRNVTFDTVCACLCAYLLFGFAWARIHMIVERVAPGSFTSGTFSAGSGFLDTEGMTATYFSLVTLSTLGFGDISPVNPDLRILVSSQAVFGQVYLAVVVARLVAMHLASEMSCEKD